MKRNRCTDQRIACELPQAEAGTQVTEICCGAGMSQLPCYEGRRRFAGMGIEELRELRKENQELKGLMAYLSFDKHML